MTVRDLTGKETAWYRFTETPGKVYGPRDMAFVFRAYGLRTTCEVCAADSEGQPDGQWFLAQELRSRLASQAVQPRQLKRLAELNVTYDPSTIDKVEAMELIEHAELQQEADPADIEEARQRGADVVAGMTRAQLNRALAPIDEADDEEEQEKERQSELAERRAALKKFGILVDPAIAEEALQQIEDAVEQYTYALEEAREWGLEAARAKARRPRSAESAVTETALLEAWVRAVSQFGGDYAALVLRRDRAPSKAMIRQAHNRLFSLMAEGETPSDIGLWVAQFVAEAEGEKRRNSLPAPQPVRASPRQPAQPTRARRDPTENERGVGYVVLIGLLVAALFIAAVVSG